MLREPRCGATTVLQRTRHKAGPGGGRTTCDRVVTCSLHKLLRLVTRFGLLCPQIGSRRPHKPKGPMTRQVRRTSTVTAVVLIVCAASGVAQTTYPNVKLSGRLQEQFYYFNNEDYAATVGPQANVFTRRARVEARGQISENVAVYVQPSFEGGRNLSGVTTTCTSTPVPVEVQVVVTPL